MTYNSPRSTSLPSGAAAFEEDLEALLPLETDSSASLRENMSSRDGHARESSSIKLMTAAQKDRCTCGPRYAP